MKIITVNIDKGGTGKSTVSFNLGKWFSLSNWQNEKTLLIDGDKSINLSKSFPKNGNSTVADIFTGKNPIEFQHVSENLDFLQGSPYLSDDKLDLKSKQNNCMIFFMWIADNYKMLEKYDYIIIDTHNDTSLVTANFLAVADIVLGVSEPSRNGFRAWAELCQTLEYLKKELVEVRSRETYVKAVPYLIANKVDTRTNSNKEFWDEAKKEKNYLGMIHDRTLMENSLLEDTSVFEMYDLMPPSKRAKESNKEFYDNIENVFLNIVNIVTKIELEKV